MQKCPFADFNQPKLDLHQFTEKALNWRANIFGGS